MGEGDRAACQGETELQFFGKMTASISHEIKNVMAIINESAGLLEDYAMMMEKGVSIDPDKLKVVSERVSKQIRRAEGITKNMNKLAHSVDDFHRGIDVGEALELSMGLAQRLADMKGVKLDLQLPQERATMITSPFHLLTLLWLVLDFAMGVSGEGGSVGIGFETASRSVRIRFSGLETFSDSSEDLFPTEKEKNLLQVLGGTISPNTEAGEVQLILPKDPGQGPTDS